MGMLDEFKDFAMRGSVLDMAIGIIIGTAFGKIISSMVSDVIMPPIGLLLGNVDLSNLFISINGKYYPSLAAAQAAGAPTVNYGVFINTVINFLIVAFVIFLLIRQVNRMRQKEKLAPTKKDCPFCMESIPIKAVRCYHCTSDLSAARA